jgi:hypothetical protein
MEGVRRAIRHIEAEDMPFAQWAAVLNTRFWNARFDQAVLRFLKSVSQANRARRPLTVLSPETAPLLREYIERADEVGAQFQTSVLRTRCLLWIYWDVLRVEGEIRLSCSRLLNHWARPEGHDREGTPLLVKLLTLPHMALLVPLRLTLDLAEDIAGLLAEQKPLYLPSAIQQFISRPGEIALDFYLDGDLSNYLRSHAVLNDNLNRRFGAVCQRWMNDVVGSEGRALEADWTVEQLWCMMREGHI